MARFDLRQIEPQMNVLAEFPAWVECCTAELDDLTAAHPAWLRAALSAAEQHRIRYTHLFRALVAGETGLHSFFALAMAQEAIPSDRRPVVPPRRVEGAEAQRGAVAIPRMDEQHPWRRAWRKAK